MQFDITLQNEDGSIAFQGIANKSEATYLLNVGVNYLLQRGLVPDLSGGDDVVVSPSTDTLQ